MAVWKAYIITGAVTTTDTRQERSFPTLSVVKLFFTVLCHRAQTQGKFLAHVCHKTGSQKGEDIKTNIQALGKCFSYSRHEVICLVDAKEHKE